MARSLHSDFLMKFTTELKTRKALPKNIELSQIGSVFMASVFNEIESEIITESIFTGMDVDPDLAILKGLVEMTERNAFADGHAKGLGSCNTKRSDGFAAFPNNIISDTKQTARKNAYYEAIERFAWATWWDDESIHHDYDLIFIADITNKPSHVMLRDLSGILPVKAVYRITPTIEMKDALVAIYFTFLEPFGVISGGAAGPSHDAESVNFRAVCELLRHCLAIRKIKTSDLTPTTFYEKRLAYFGLTQNGSDLAMTRLIHQGNKTISFPSLSIDEQVSHELSDLVSVHRCYFENQPPFVGGDLERLCL